ncbi:MAG: LysR family transcriptional regulator [Dehalobacterium sp.]
MRTEQLAQIIEIAKKKSVSEAARSLAISQSQLSHSLKSLEYQLGYPLFRRTYQGMIPTSRGKEILRIAHEILDNLEEIKMIGSHKSELSGNLNLLLEPAVFNAFQAKVLVAFNQIHPNINLMISENSSEKIIIEVADNYGFLGVTGWLKDEDTTWKKILDRHNLASEELLQDKIILIAGKDHPLANQKCITLADLGDSTFINYYQLSDVYISEIVLKKYKNPSIDAHSREILKMLLADNVGVTLLPRFFLQGDLYLEQGLLKILEIQEMEENFVVYLIHTREESIKYGARELKKILKQTLTSDDKDLWNNSKEG